MQSTFAVQTTTVRSVVVPTDREMLQLLRTVSSTELVLRSQESEVSRDIAAENQADDSDIF